MANVVRMEAGVGSVIGDLLPLAVGVAVSPTAVIAVILMLFAPKARATSFGFMLGWVFGIVAAVVVSLLLSGEVETGTSREPSTVVSWIKVALGVVALAIAIEQWRVSLKEAPAPAMPKWMNSIDKVNLPQAAGLGFVMSAVNPTNLALCAAAGVTISGGSLSGGADAVAVTAFAVIACTTVVVPVAAYGIAADRMRNPLDSFKRWLEEHNAAVTAVLMLVIGAVLVGKGLGGLL
jgi:Sap-like sulfolipid-1-addressing protein